MIMERLVAPAGPTGGKILRPSDGAAPRRVAFVQCAGSRDVNHLPYCSAVCCLASLKQAMYVKDQLPESEVTVYYIDRRTPGRNEEMLTRAGDLDGVEMVKGKVGKVEKGAGGALSLRVEDADSGRLLETEADLVVLATGMVSNLEAGSSPFALPMDADGFGLDDNEAKLFVAGVARRPEDVAASVRDATGTSAKACVAATGRAVLCEFQCRTVRWFLSGKIESLDRSRDQYLGSHCCLSVLERREENHQTSARFSCANGRTDRQSGCRNRLDKNQRLEIGNSVRDQTLLDDRGGPDRLLGLALVLAASGGERQVAAVGRPGGVGIMVATRHGRVVDPDEARRGVLLQVRRRNDKRHPAAVR